MSRGLALLFEDGIVFRIANEIRMLSDRLESIFIEINTDQNSIGVEVTHGRPGTISYAMMSDCRMILHHLGKIKSIFLWVSGHKPNINCHRGQFVFGVYSIVGQFFFC